MHHYICQVTYNPLKVKVSLWAPTSSWRPFGLGPLNFVLWASLFCSGCVKDLESWTRISRLPRRALNKSEALDFSWLILTLIPSVSPPMFTVQFDQCFIWYKNEEKTNREKHSGCSTSSILLAIKPIIESIFNPIISIVAICPTEAILLAVLTMVTILAVFVYSTA